MRRARERVYHLACFACDACSRQLSTGEQFALLDARLLCKAHYLDVVEGNNTSSDGENVARTCDCRGMLILEEKGLLWLATVSITTIPIISTPVISIVSVIR